MTRSSEPNPTARAFEPVAIQVVYPTPDHVCFEAQTFVMGQVRALPESGQLRIQGDAVPLSPHGFFSWPVPLNPGANPVVLSVHADTDSPPLTQTVITLYQEPPLAVLPSLPLAVHPETLLPASDVWLSENDTLTVACSASQGSSVSVSIPGLMDQPLPLTPVSQAGAFLDQRETIFAELHQTRARIPTAGYYRIKIPAKSLFSTQKHAENLKRAENLPIMLHLQHGKHQQSLPLPGRLTLLHQPIAAVVQADESCSRTTPVTGARLTPQVAQTKLWIDGLDQGWARARLNPGTTLYLPREDLNYSNRSGLAFLESIHAQCLQPHQLGIRLTLSGNRRYACPLHLDADRLGLTITLYHLSSRCDFMHFHPNTNALLEDLHWQQTEEHTVQVHIRLREHVAGLDYRWQDHHWHLTINTLPKPLSEVRILLDPGHGGDESGSIGLDGQPEKHLNLTLARAVESALQEAGFHQVFLTRHGDETVSLGERVAIARETQAHILLSLHHNALPDGRDPSQYQGVSSYYYHRFSKPLAHQLLSGLTRPLPQEAPSSTWSIPNHGLYYDSLVMTRIRQNLAVLLELGFFTHPDDYERLIQPNFQTCVARRLAHTLAQFCAS